MADTTRDSAERRINSVSASAAKSQGGTNRVAAKATPKPATKEAIQVTEAEETGRHGMPHAPGEPYEYDLATD